MTSFMARAATDHAQVSMTVVGSSHARHSTGVEVAGVFRLDDSAAQWHDVSTRDGRIPTRGSDAELMLLLWLHHGERCVDRLVGDFAFVVHDPRTHVLFAARDHLGIHGLYWARSRDGIVISNDITTVRAEQGVSDALNEQIIGDFLLTGQLVATERTAFADVHRLPAAHTLRWQGGTARVSRYWSLPVAPPREPLRGDDLVAEFRALFSTAIADRVQSSPATVLMSGGIDSAAVAAEAHTHATERGQSLSAVTMGYRRLIPDKEFDVVGTIAEARGLSVEYQELDDFSLLDGIDFLPLGCGPDLSLFPSQTIALRELLTRVAPVVLTGQGGDAAMLPWPSYALSLVRRMSWGILGRGIARSVQVTGRVPRLGVRSAFAALNAPRRVPLPLPGWLNTDLAERAGLFERAHELAPEMTMRHPWRPTAYDSLTQPAWDFYLESLQPVATGTPLSFRHPLLDIRLVSFLLSVPSLPWCNEKLILREAMRNRLPLNVLRRRKTALVADPVVAALLQNGCDEATDFVPATGLERFIVRSKVPDLPMLRANPSAIYTHLRLFCLNSWLRRLENTKVLLSSSTSSTSSTS